MDPDGSISWKVKTGEAQSDNIEMSGRFISVITTYGVVSSDSDELEGRFPAGKANICTSSLLYDALNSAAYLGRDLGKSTKLIAQYKDMAKALKIC